MIATVGVCLLVQVKGAHPQVPIASFPPAMQVYRCENQTWKSQLEYHNREAIALPSLTIHAIWCVKSVAQMGWVTFKVNYMVLGVCSNYMSKTNTFSQVALNFWLYAISGDQHNKIFFKVAEPQHSLETSKGINIWNKHKVPHKCEEKARKKDKLKWVIRKSNTATGKCIPIRLNWQSN